MAPSYVNYHLEHHLCPLCLAIGSLYSERCYKTRGCWLTPSLTAIVASCGSVGVSFRLISGLKPFRANCRGALLVVFTLSIGGTDVPLIVMWTAVAALFFTVYLRFINVRALGLAITMGDFSDPTARGESAISKPWRLRCQGLLVSGISVGWRWRLPWAARCGFLALHRRIVVDVDRSWSHAGREIPAL